MGYRNLQGCLSDLEARGDLLRIEEPLDPHLEIGAVQRRVFRAGGPALLFTNPAGCHFPMAGNLFGTRERIRYIFRDGLRRFETLHKTMADPLSLLRQPAGGLGLARGLWHSRPRRVNKAPILQRRIPLSKLPRLVSWPRDGGGFVTLPQVYTEHPEHPGFRFSNLGMYRIQLDGNDFVPDREAGLHYQIHRGIGSHHSKALQRGEPLRVNVFVGGPPAMSLAAVMPLPEGVPEVFFAGFIGGHRIPFTAPSGELPLPAEADFCLSGTVRPGVTKPEGPFGDHLGYYSLRHEFPVMEVDSVRCREDAVWPFTTVGRPPQEDSVLGEFIHELTGPLVPRLFKGVSQIHAVDAAGVHPLLLAVGSERYVPFAGERIPQELLTNANQLLGSTQTSLSKYVLIAAGEDNPDLSVYNVPEFLEHMLTRMDPRRDLHFITRTTMDTLDYSGISLNQGSKLILAAAGPQKRNLATELPRVAWPEGFSDPRLFHPGILLLQGRPHAMPRDSRDPEMEHLCAQLQEQDLLREWPLLVVVDDVPFCAASWDNFLWAVFTRSDPATDMYGLGAFTHCKHWGCSGALVLDARLKTYHAPVLEPDPDVERKVDNLGASGGPLHGII